LGKNKVLCTKCHKSYNPEDNTNWACRIHPSEWGGKIYWCCGKNNIKAAGCKRARHITREEQEKLERYNITEDSDEEAR
jgi:hypothetical protein